MRISKNFDTLHEALAYARTVRGQDDPRIAPSRTKPTNRDLKGLAKGKPLIIGYPGGYVYVMANEEAPTR